MNFSYSKRRMNASVAASSEILDKKWHKITYEKHKKRMKLSLLLDTSHSQHRGCAEVQEVKGTIGDQNHLKYNYEEIQLQMRLRRAIAEERRQAVIDQENRKLLERLVQISTSQRTHYPQPWLRKKKINKTKKKEEKHKKAHPEDQKLPPINKQENRKT